MAHRCFGDHLFHPLAVEVLLIPLHVGEKLLQPLLTGPGDGLRHSVAILVGQCGEQPCQVALQGGLALRATEAHLEGGQKLVQLGQRGWTGVYIHGYPPFLSKDTSCKSKLTK